MMHRTMKQGAPRQGSVQQGLRTREPRQQRKLLRLLFAIAISMAAISFDQGARSACAQPAFRSNTGELEITPQELAADVQRTETAAELDPMIRQKLLDLYEQAQGELQNSIEWSRKATASEAARLAAPQELEKMQAELARPPAAPSAPGKDVDTLSELESLLSTADAQWKAARKELASWEAEPQRRADWRRIELPKLAEAANRVLEELQKQLEGMAIPAQAADRFADARRKVAWCVKQRVQMELAALEADRMRYESGIDWVTAKRDLAARHADQAEAEVRRWQELVDQRRRADADLQARDAKWAAALAHPQLRTLAEQNAELTKRQKGAEGWPNAIADAARKAVEFSEQRSELQAQFARVREKVKAAGHTNAVGQLLKREQNELPDIHQHRDEMKIRQAKVSEVQLQLIELEDARASVQEVVRWLNRTGPSEELRHVDPEMQEALNAVESQATEDEREDLQRKLLDLLQARLTIIGSLIDDANTYFYKLLDLDENQQRLITAADEYSEYLCERVLWVKSDPALGVVDLVRAGEALRWLCDPAKWIGLARCLRTDMVDNLPLYGLAACVGATALMFHRRLRRRIADIGRKNTPGAPVSLWQTFDAVVCTLLITAMGPALFWFFSWRLASAWAASDFAKTVAFGLRSIAVVYATTELLRQVCRRHGLADSHFQWYSSSLAVLRRNLRWLIAIGLPLTFLVAVIEGLGRFQGRELYKASLGRLAFMSALIILAVFFQRVLSPKRGVPREIIARNPGGWLDRFSPVWYPLLVAAPLLSAALAAWGYYYTALQLTWRLEATVWLGLALVVCYSFLLRCVLVSRRHLAIQQSRRRRAAVLLHSPEQLAHAVTHEGTAIAGPVTEDPVECDLSAVHSQTSRLLRSIAVTALLIGVWLVWVDVLPALRVVSHWQLWTIAGEAVSTVVGADGKPVVGTGPHNVAITIGDLTLALVIVLMTVAAGRNLPGLLEMTLLQRLPLDPGGRYALTAISRYIITVIGLIFAFRAIGIGWSNVQWLVAAVTVGLGFGLQEIFANFVSGLIILFERPMRVGDTVTVGGFSGTVSRIRIRATTITDWDRKELIVPNREFITGHVVNWTLSDTVLRMVIKVGVVYGSNTNLATQLLLDSAHAHTLVLQHPAPSAVFQGFGNNTLEFELRVFVSGMEHLSVVRHELNTAIDGAFRAAGIEMAFPQQEIHLRSISAEFSGLELVSPKVSKKAA
jgi:potassium efflux system protein